MCLSRNAQVTMKTKEVETVSIKLNSCLTFLIVVSWQKPDRGKIKLNSVCRSVSMECRPAVFGKPRSYDSSKRCAYPSTAVRETATGTQTGSVWLKVEHWPSASRLWWQWQQGTVVIFNKPASFLHLLIIFIDVVVCHLSCWFGTTPRWAQCKHTWITWLQWKPLPGPPTSTVCWPLGAALPTAVSGFGTPWPHSRCSAWTLALRSATWPGPNMLMSW